MSFVDAFAKLGTYALDKAAQWWTGEGSKESAQLQVCYIFRRVSRCLVT